MSVSTKRMSEKDFGQILRSAYSDEDKTISTSGFLDGKVGHRMQTTTVSSTIDDTRYFDEVSVQTCTLNSNTTVNVPNTGSLSVGQYVLLDLGEAGIPLNTTIASIDSEVQITLSAAATVSGSYSVHFANLLKRLRIVYNNSTHDILLDAARVE